MGTIVIDSVPPAKTTSANPARISRAAIAIDCNPEAEPVDRHRGDAVGHPRLQGADAGDVHPLLRLGHRAAEDHVVDARRVEVRHAGQRRANRRRAKIVRAGVLQASPCTPCPPPCAPTR